MRLPGYRVRQPAVPLPCRPWPRLILTARIGASEDFLTELNHRQAPFRSPGQRNRAAPGGRKPGTSRGTAARASPPRRPQPCAPPPPRRSSLRRLAGGPRLRERPPKGASRRWHDRTGAVPHQCAGVRQHALPSGADHLRASRDNKRYGRPPVRDPAIRHALRFGREDFEPHAPLTTLRDRPSSEATRALPPNCIFHGSVTRSSETLPNEAFCAVPASSLEASRRLDR
jgi:hypothetical protein